MTNKYSYEIIGFSLVILLLISFINVSISYSPSSLTSSTNLVKTNLKFSTNQMEFKKFNFSKVIFYLNIELKDNFFEIGKSKNFSLELKPISNNIDSNVNLDKINLYEVQIRFFKSFSETSYYSILFIEKGNSNPQILNFNKLYFFTNMVKCPFQEINSDIWLEINFRMSVVLKVISTNESFSSSYDVTTPKYFGPYTLSKNVTNLVVNTFEIAILAYGITIIYYSLRRYRGKS